jgi:uncharacterized protein Usg
VETTFRSWATWQQTETSAIHSYRGAKALTFELDDEIACRDDWCASAGGYTAKERAMASNDFIRQLEGYGLTTASILYGFPDHPDLLQSFVWQDYDLAPKFPILTKFLDFWRRELDGPLHSVTVAHSALIKPAEFSVVNGIITLH